MGLRTKQPSVDHQGLEYWSQTSLPPHAAEELPKPAPIQRQHPLQQQAERLNCPRCGSANTKFCYYNNYNKSQPRHFCKSCKRHWTKGGTLRNVPVGGGRKNKRFRVSDAPTTTTTACTKTTARTTTAQDWPSFAPTDIDRDQTSMSNILYKYSSSSPLDGIIVSKSGKTNMTCLNVSTPQNPNAEYPLFSRLSTTFDKDTYLINPTSYQSLEDQYDHYSMNLDSIEESTITTLDIPTASSTPWPGPEINSFMDLPNYWNWNEIDVLPSSADLDIAWDDMIKP
ncbi:hypothetical protein CDL12_19786 [Handroanthus impetiginosus]|uniref:Dof zinc finger protein n=1 Tax=Handroanthus impetiginosus TaxID=429701 RepID=A0A2G9GQT1_9LAMI|nr:hypothetical protein CDL12_19786 [Handroanthus impetiginosus]